MIKVSMITPVQSRKMMNTGIALTLLPLNPSYMDRKFEDSPRLTAGNLLTVTAALQSPARMKIDSPFARQPRRSGARYLCFAPASSGDYA